jgi:hypothetical protein
MRSATPGKRPATPLQRFVELPLAAAIAPAMLRPDSDDEHAVAMP